MKLIQTAFVALICLTFVSGCGQSNPESATLVITDTRVWTGDKDKPWAEAVAVKDTVIMAVGTNADIAEFVDSKTQIIVATGNMLVPGFIDSHVHFLDGGASLASVQLRDAASKEEFVRRIGDFASSLEPGEWVLQGTWDHENWGGELPRRDWIDAVTPNNPVWIIRLDGHMALANSLALKQAGVDADSPDIAGGEIVRDENGYPTGVLKDNAMSLVSAAVPPPGEAAWTRQINAAMDYVASNGVTTVHDMYDALGDPATSQRSLNVYRKLHADKELITRIYLFSALSRWQLLRDYIEENGRGDDWLKFGGLKGFMDGSLGSHTAAFFEPFTDAPDDRGFLINELDDVRAWVDGADKAGLHVTVHAIGTLANKELLDIFFDVAEANGERDRRFRIEHAQHLRPDEIARFKAQNVIASMQPYHAIDDGRWAEKVIGPERAKTTYAFRSLIESGAHVAFGSDWFVAPATPLEGIYAAVTRRTLDGANPGGWVPEQKISVDEALRAYTVEGAYASFDEDKKGMIIEGFLADLVLINRDLTAIPPTAIRDARVLTTIVGGEIVYDTVRETH
ncbi:MAG: amidohydrolase [Woeseiaceae bacterium]|nr:amidohydrolase [Woeseiaceae bacterium]